MTYEWRWGARSHAEVGEDAIARFVADFMAERILRTARDDDDDEEDKEKTDCKGRAVTVADG